MVKTSSLTVSGAVPLSTLLLPQLVPHSTANLTILNPWDAAFEEDDEAGVEVEAVAEAAAMAKDEAEAEAEAEAVVVCVAVRSSNPLAADAVCPEAEVEAEALGSTINFPWQMQAVTTHLEMLLKRQSLLPWKMKRPRTLWSLPVWLSALKAQEDLPPFSPRI